MVAAIAGAMPMQRVRARAQALVYVALGMVAFSALSVLLPLWWLVEPAPVITLSPPVVVGAPGGIGVAHAGGTITVRREFCVDRPLVGTVSRELHRGVVAWQLAAHAVASSPGCRDGVYTSEIPAAVPPGTYQYIAVIDYELNPVRRYRVVLPSGTVEIR